MRKKMKTVNKIMKKFDKKIVKGLISQIDEEMKKKTSKRETIRLTRKEQNVVKAIDDGAIFDKTGEWDGYGYKRLGKHLHISSFSRIKRSLKKLSTKENKTRIPTEEEEKEQWAKRLSALTKISFYEATEIAEEKIEYKSNKIEQVEERQYERYSNKRASLIRQMQRENPLRRIKDKNHAEAILIAHSRHNNTNYEDKLEEGRELASIGEIGKGEVKEYARSNMLY